MAAARTSPSAFRSRTGGPRRGCSSARPVYLPALPLPFTPFTSSVLIAYLITAYATASALTSSASRLTLSNVSQASW